MEQNIFSNWKAIPWIASSKSSDQKTKIQNSTTISILDINFNNLNMTWSAHWLHRIASKCWWFVTLGLNLSKFVYTYQKSYIQKLFSPLFCFLCVTWWQNSFKSISWQLMPTNPRLSRQTVNSGNEYLKLC